MARFEPGKAVPSEEARIKVDDGLPPGQYIFQLEVEDELGGRSQPDQRLVIVDKELGSRSQTDVPINETRR